MVGERGLEPSGARHGVSLARGLTVVTNNLDEFRRVLRLNVVEWRG